MAENSVASVGIKLVLDSNAAAVTASMQKDIGAVEGKAHKSFMGVNASWGANAGAMRSMASGAFGAIGSAAVVGAGLAVAGAGMVIGAAVKSAHAFYEEEEAIRGIAGAFLVLDQNSNTFDNLMGLANGVNEELTQMAIKAGTTDDALRGVFTNVIERGGKSVEEATKLTGQLAMAGKAIPGGAEKLSEGFEAIEMGVIRARNPIVGLIASQHLLKGNAKQVAAEMMKLPVDKQMALAEQAVGKLANKMKDAPLTLGQMGKSMDTLVHDVFESAGKPIVRAFEPVMGSVLKLTADNAGVMNKAAEHFGQYIAKGVEFAGLVMNEVTRAVRANWTGIQSAFSAIYGPAMNLFDYIYKNKEAFAKTLVDVAVELVKAVASIAKAMMSVRDTVGTVIKAMAMAGLGGEGVKKFAGEEERTAIGEEAKKKVTRFGSLLPEERVGYEKQIVKSAQESGVDNRAALDMFSAQLARGSEDLQTLQTAQAQSVTATSALDAQQYADAFNIASTMQSDAMMKNIASVLAGNTMMADAIGKKGPDIFKGGVDNFITRLAEIDPLMAKKLKEDFKPNIGKTPVTNQTFTGAINIKQDFRDQDPDQIMVLMRKDLARAGSSRAGARTGMPGGF